MTQTSENAADTDSNTQAICQVRHHSLQKSNIWLWILFLLSLILFVSFTHTFSPSVSVSFFFFLHERPPSSPSAAHWLLAAQSRAVSQLDLEKLTTSTCNSPSCICMGLCFVASLLNVAGGWGRQRFVNLDVQNGFGDEDTSAVDGPGLDIWSLNHLMEEEFVLCGFTLLHVLQPQRWQHEESEKCYR